MTGLELLKAPEATAGEIADIISAPCPPTIPAHCDGVSCRACWLAWLTGEPLKGKEPPDKRTAPDDAPASSTRSTASRAASAIDNTPSPGSGPAPLYTIGRAKERSSRMFSTEDLKTAIGATVIARRNAAARLREAGNPRDPFRALPGMEQQFFEAAQSVRSYDLVLNLLEREVKREARKRAGRTAQSAAAFIITAGLIILATLGFAAALLLMRCPVPAVSVTAFIGVAVSLGWAVIRK